MHAAAPPAPHLAAPLLALAAASPDAEATRCGGRVRSRAQLAARVAALAHALRARLGVQDGAVVALCAASTDALLEAWLAVAAAGGIAAPLNTRWCG
jgi:acyl-CoA synthetase (AMP-forming)/AMP-acid ligase II